VYEPSAETIRQQTEKYERENKDKLKNILLWVTYKDG
jgi:hypothetical protein